MLEKTLESPLDCKELQPVHPKGDQSWVFIGRTDAEAGTPTQVIYYLITILNPLPFFIFKKESDVQTFSLSDVGIYKISSRRRTPITLAFPVIRSIKLSLLC